MEIFEKFYNRTLLNQPNSTGIITRAPRAGFKGNEGFGAPEENILKWPTFRKRKKKKLRSSSNASLQAKLRR